MKMLRLSVVAIIVLGILCAAGYWGWGWWTHGRFIETTDNAYVQADIAVIASKHPGQSAG
jgi:membrane fusion protein, multidrug efflux system